jgi:PAS domain S-box-containing protein
MKADLGKLLVDESQDAVVTTPADGKMLWWSKGAEAIHGYWKDPPVGRTMIEIIVPRRPGRKGASRRDQGSGEGIVVRGRFHARQDRRCHQHRGSSRCDARVSTFS